MPKNVFIWTHVTAYAMWEKASTCRLLRKRYWKYYIKRD